jgi:hypothetical protein
MTCMDWRLKYIGMRRGSPTAKEQKEMANK